ncbi:phenylalanine--tRNA ligase subunit beta [Aquisalinus flavus]|uniref:Phenylalanine--tRNA ligase beta subunit n=1 Tax=Aquisalinus flavus TaxID=1526572 RepID=A0A8J2V6K8_9PROT|nr:phenylalanine--tRNA ligase subunit beta [Aquisalinus flavus]MBD0425644.1 phenylalanine--tRNA ligase subunit beta [Aquisalinus flavus]UNE48740.1 phenylalanine--tRNA ligase subunit beta [Aquisalinus flavus]GGD14390.1 phenylalanine--tRNA ligase beta subunit [Aquisalinus flavus]
MKFTLSWLKKHLDTDATLEEIVEAMVRVGLEVEEVDDPAARLKDFTIGHVIDARPHPDADKLRVCRVATKDGEQQIVCGAPNARTGIKVAYAPVGAYVPGIDATLGKAKIRGVESNGMMCSARELEMGDDHDGIIEAPESAEIGQPVAEVMGVNDPVIDFEVTPNRPDTNGVAGVARDLAAAGLGTLITKPYGEPQGDGYDSPVSVELDFAPGTENACPVFAGVYVRGVKNGQSPKWLRDQLRAIGLRPINALADITNYVSYDRARPLHVYDAAKIRPVIRARLGKEGETLEALDGKTYKIDATMTVIADDTRVLGLGGIMGGEYSGVEADTTDVFIESAYFDPVRTARTGRKTGIVSDARYRNERGIDPASCVAGLAQAVEMVRELCGGAVSNVVLAGAVPDVSKTVAFPPAEVKRLTGIDLDAAEMERILTALGFGVAPGDAWSVSVPSFRPDIEGKADLVEEIARIVGLDQVPSTPLPRLAVVEAPKYSRAQDRVRLAKRALASRGYLESITWSFCDAPEAALFSGRQSNPDLVLANPISSDLGHMRPSILPNLISALRRNADRGRDDLALFEVGPVYAGDGPTDQATLATGVRLSSPVRHWQGAQRADVFTAKADAIAALEAAGAPVANLMVMANAPDWYHPGRSGVLSLGPKNVLAEFGEIHPRVLKAMDIDGPVYGFEVRLDNIPLPKGKGGKTKPALDASSLQAVSRDFAFIVPTAMPAEDLMKAVRGADKKLIAAASLFDVYEGPGVGEGEKSLAIEVTLQPRDRTLTDEEIDAVAARIIAQAEKAGATLRG